MYPWPLVKIHISWLIASWCVGVVAGVVVVMSLPAGLFAGMGWLLLSAVIILPMVKTQRRWMVLLAVMSGLIFGLWRGGVGQSGLDYYEQLAGSKVAISGRIT